MCPGVNERNVVLMLIIHKVTKSPRQMQVNTMEPQGGKTHNLEDGHDKEEETTRRRGETWQKKMLN